MITCFTLRNNNSIFSQVFSMKNKTNETDVHLQYFLFSSVSVLFGADKWWIADGVLGLFSFLFFIGSYWHISIWDRFNFFSSCSCFLCLMYCNELVNGPKLTWWEIWPLFSSGDEPGDAADDCLKWRSSWHLQNHNVMHVTGWQWGRDSWLYLSGCGCRGQCARPIHPRCFPCFPCACGGGEI